MRELILRAGDLHPPENLPEDLPDKLPDNPDRWFGRPAPLVLEIGFGGGHYLSHLAVAHPEWNLLGAEVSLASVWRAYRRIKRRVHRSGCRAG